MLPSEYYYMTGYPVKLNYNLGEIHQPRLFDFMDNDITIEEFAQPFCARVDVVDFGDDEKVNEIKGEELEISTPNSKVKVLVVPTNEELMIARDCIRVGKIELE